MLTTTLILAALVLLTAWDTAANDAAPQAAPVRRDDRPSTQPRQR